MTYFNAEIYPGTPVIGRVGLLVGGRGCLSGRGFVQRGALPLAELVSSQHQTWHMFALAVGVLGFFAFAGLASFRGKNNQPAFLEPRERRYWGSFWDFLFNDLAWEWALRVYGAYYTKLAKLYGARPFATSFFYVALVATFLITFIGLVQRPMYEIYVDQPSESIVKKEAQLLKGRSQVSLLFGKIDALTIAPLDHENYVLEAAVVGGAPIEMGRGPQRKMAILAEVISANSGARVR